MLEDQLPDSPRLMESQCVDYCNQLDMEVSGGHPEGTYCQPIDGDLQRAQDVEDQELEAAAARALLSEGPQDPASQDQ